MTVDTRRSGGQPPVVNFESIFVLVDLDRPSPAVLRSAAQLAASGGLRVDFAVVLPKGEGEPEAVATVESGMSRSADASLTDVEDEFRSMCETEADVVRTVLFGDVETVTAHAASAGHDLVIVGEGQKALAGGLRLSVLVVR